MSATGYSSWPTPAAADSERSTDYIRRREDNPTLTGAARSLWPTPDAGISNDGETPESFLARQESLKAKGYNSNGAGTPLAMAAVIWPTPTTSDGGVESSRVHGDKLATRLGQFAPSRPDPAPEPNGQPSSPPGRTSRPRLNPAFVEFLMGWPEGWSIASIDSGCSATELCRWLRLQRSWLSRLGLG